jgi:hypothetical protein
MTRRFVAAGARPSASAACQAPEYHAQVTRFSFKRSPMVGSVCGGRVVCLAGSAYSPAVSLDAGGLPLG